ncbi:hypothetical protein BC937DRAFT_94008 [Endogone sp. FLAS-F59071]|nr:hypothetical protein BC937DRAFT_94008 [Endogone sp. FLAS-F59071]|eukprot:RUS14322.1 hypothetical protein BC937DRAFT_94008 [Endogone sp. FLAS-F59071]
MTFQNGHAIIIGTGTDTQGTLSRKYISTINDAEWLHKVLTEPSLCAYPDDQVHLLSGEKATRENIEREFDKLKKLMVKSKDRQASIVVVFFSGHGIRCPGNGKTYLAPFGVNGQDLTTLIDGDFLYDKLDSIKAGKTLLLINCCYAAGVISTLVENEEPPNEERMEILDEEQVEILRTSRAFCILSAAQAAERAYTAVLSKTRKRYSPFTIGLSRGFSGKGKTDPTAYVKCGDLVTVCSAYLGKITKLKQTPSVNYDGKNFEVGHYTGSAADKFPELGDDIEVDIDDTEEEEVKDLEIRQQTVTTNNYSGVFKGAGMIIGSQSFGNGNNFSYAPKYPKPFISYCQSLVNDGPEHYMPKG